MFSEEQVIRQVLPQANSLLMRNNIGVAEDKRGVPVRYGLMNISTQMNQKIKSSDYVGITPIMIHPHHVGRTFGVFTGLEFKKHPWVYRGKGREVAQMEWVNLVRSWGGFAGFVTCYEDYLNIIRS